MCAPLCPAMLSHAMSLFIVACRYAANDPVEAWLNGLLCLDSTLAPATNGACPHPDQCELYSIDRDTLFSYNKVSEVFLQRMVALYVSSHYKVC